MLDEDYHADFSLDCALKDLNLTSEAGAETWPTWVDTDRVATTKTRQEEGGFEEFFEFIASRTRSRLVRRQDDAPSLAPNSANWARRCSFCAASST
jgi:hypothetical protein